MKDYYSILEINESSSKETIDKVHKLLIKRYHPDLQPENEKKVAEEKMKVINEAYEVLTDPSKKQKYDAELKEYKIQKIMEEIRIKNQANNIKQQPKYDQGQNVNSHPKTENIKIVYNQPQSSRPFNVSDDEIRRQAQVYYDELCKQYLYRNGYVRTRKSSFKDKLAKFLTVIIMIGFIYLMFKIPYFRNLLKDIINSNMITETLFEGILD